jgi:hypothetical protein
MDGYSLYNLIFHGVGKLLDIRLSIPSPGWVCEEQLFGEDFVVFNYLLAAAVNEYNITLVEPKCNFPDRVLFDKTQQLVCEVVHVLFRPTTR